VNVVRESGVLKRIAQEKGVGVEHLVLSWQLQLGIAVVPRSKSEDHVRENARLLVGEGGRVVLSNKEMAEIAGLDGMAEKVEREEL
jgi:diketogulonate reductase-like aldo/keto reductase